MSKNETLAAVAATIAVSLAVIVVACLIGGFFYFTLVYNNNQNIKRDEYYATHCKVITDQESMFGTAKVCGAAK